jgi:RES domain-containing protein
MGDPIVEHGHRRRLPRLRLQRVQQVGEPGADALITQAEEAVELEIDDIFGDDWAACQAVESSMKQGLGRVDLQLSHRPGSPRRTAES